MQVLLQYQSKSYYIIGQEVYYSIGRFITLSGSYYIIGRFLLHYRAVITVSGVYYIIGWYKFYQQDEPHQFVGWRVETTAMQRYAARHCMQPAKKPASR